MCVLQSNCMVSNMVCTSCGANLLVSIMTVKFLFSEAVMKCKKMTALEVELDCREWFRLASDRDGGRKK